MARNLIINGKIHLYGYVGAEDDGGEGFTPSEVAQALAQFGPDDPISVHVNSGGGIAYAGMTIYSQFAAHNGEVTIFVDGVAASAASLLAMAGDKIVMRTGTTMMIHDPSGVTIGPAHEHAAAAAALNKLADNYAAVYAARSGKDVAKVRDIMLATTWLTADEAVSEGFATEKIEAKSLPMAKFDYEIYGAVPEPLRASIEKRPTVVKATAADLAAVRMRMAAAAI